MEVNNNSEINKMFGTDSEVNTVSQEAAVPVNNPEVSPDNANNVNNETGSSVPQADETDVYMSPEMLEAQLSSDLINTAKNEDPEPADGFRPEKPENTENTEYPEEDIIDGSGHSFGFASTKEIKKAKKEANPKLARIMVAVTTFPVALVIGVVLGIFICFSVFFGLHVSKDYSAAIKAVEAVRSYKDLNKDGKGDEKIIKEEKDENGKKIKTKKEKEILQDVVFLNIFVKNKTNEFECIVFCSVKEDAMTFTETSYRVVIDKNNDKIDIYGEFNPAEHERLINGTEEEHIFADLMEYYRAEYNRCIGEINSGNGDWVEVDPTYITARGKLKLITFIDNVFNK